MSEEWKVIPDFTKYEASNLGRIKSFQGREARIIKPNLNRGNGYIYCHLQATGSKKSTTRALHRLILEAFVGPRPEGTEACHLNGNKADNRLKNLRWMTHVENCQHMIIHRTRSKCERAGSAKLTNEEAFAVRLLLKEKKAPLALVASMFGISVSQAGGIARGTFFKHLRVVEDFIIEEQKEI